MTRTAVRLLALPLTIGLLQACQQKPAEVAAALPAASAVTAAADDAPAALMAEAFKGWTATAPLSVQVPSGEGSRADRVLVSPALVATLDADHRLLVVSGVPDDGHGQPEQSHATMVNLGVYGFERQGGRWVKTFERPSLVWTGAYGQAGDLKIHPLGAGRTALSIENEYCGQGHCSGQLQLFSLAANEARVLFQQTTAANATDATIGCAEWLAGKPLPEAETPDPMTPANCHDVRGTWRFEKTGEAGWPDVVLTFQGKQAVQDPKTEQVSVATVNEQLVLRHDGSGYKTFSGRNPLDSP